MANLNRTVTDTLRQTCVTAMTLLVTACGLQPIDSDTLKEASAPAAGEQLEADWASPEDAAANEFLNFCQTNYIEVESIYEQVKSGYSSDSEFLDALNELDRLLNATLARASLYANVHPSEVYRQTAEQCDQNFTTLLSEIALSQALFEQVEAIDIGVLTGVDKRYATELLRDFKRSGVNLAKEKRDRIKELNEEINLVSMAFYKNSREDVRSLDVKPERLAGLPEDFIAERLNEETGLVTVTTNYPDYFPVMQYADDDSLRFELYKIFRSRGNPENKKVLNDLLSLRNELATTLGYKNYADYIIEVQMIGEPQKAQDFIDKITRVAQPLAQKEYAELLTELQKIDPEATVVGDWQKTYLQEKIKKAKYEVDSQVVRAYFPYQHVKGGVIELVETLFDIKIRPWETETWHESVEAFELVDNGKVLGRFFLDMHPREGKYKHAAAFTLQDGIEDQQLPIKALVCNFPSGDELMEHMQVETFLHEFGHLLHGIFGGQSKWISHAGTPTERDFVEAPSQMLEEWVWDKATLALLSQNEAGETIPDALVDKMNASRNFGKGIFTTQQMFYAAVSLNYYNREPATFDDTELLIDLQQKYSNFDYVDGTNFQYAFGHLVGYSASYYGYMWSLVIADDLFSEFEKGGLMNKDIAKRYRKEILEPGGSKDATAMVEAFLGRPYTFDAFAKKFN